MIDKKLLNELFGFYNDKERIQLQNQIDIMTNYILEHADIYNKSKDFSIAVDDILKLILAGKFINKGE